MGIRIDQLHSEVFEKISKDLEAKSIEFRDYLDSKIGELDIVFGLPETTHIERDVETNKRNLEKSGFIELNRNFSPFRTAEQKDTGVWISNLETNESPFEPLTIDGQKRGINVAGYNLNYTKGNIGQNFDKLLKLPIAPNLPIFFPEENDMIHNFQPTKLIVNEKIVVDNAINIDIYKRITDDNKIDIDQMEDNGELKYYYMDEDGNIFFLNNEGRVYAQNNPDTLLIEPYNRFSIPFAKNFQFEKIFDFDGREQFIDSVDNRLFSIVGPESSDAKKIGLLSDSEKVYLKDMTVTRFIDTNNDGILEETSVTQPMLVKLQKSTETIAGLETEVITPILVSEATFNINTEYLSSGATAQCIQDNNIKMYLDETHLYSYHPYSKFVYDENNNPVMNSDGTQQTEIDTNYVKYISYDEIDDTTNMTIDVIDNLTGNTVARDVMSTIELAVTYYKVDTLMVGDLGDIVTELDQNGNYVTAGNVNRPLKINDASQLETLTGGLVDIVSEGKEFYYYPTVGTKYYKKSNGNIYFIDNSGNKYEPSNDVQEIFMATMTNTDTDENTDIMVYVANNYTFYIDSENLRSYIIDETKLAIQLTDLNGYRVFKKSDGTEVYILNDSDGSLKKIIIDSSGNQIEVSYEYSELKPVFETEKIEEYVLNTIIDIPFNIIQGDVTITRNDIKLSLYADYEIEGILTLDKALEFNEELNKGDSLYVKRIGKKDIILRMEKRGTPSDDYANDWANDTGLIVMPEPLTGNSYNWVDGQELNPGEELNFNDIVKKEDRYFLYTGTSISYDDLPADDKTISVNVGGINWEDVTVQELEWERKDQNYKLFNLVKGETIRFTVIRRIWEQNSTTGEMIVTEKDPYTIEKEVLQDGENVFVLNDPNFILDNDPTLESYILVIEKIAIFDEYIGNRANTFKLMLTGLQTVAVNEDPAMIYGESYFLSNNTLYLQEAEISDQMTVIRRQASQLELKIEFTSEGESPKVTVPFNITKNKFDIVIPKKLDGHEYTWIMGERLPEGKTLKTGDVVFDKNKIKFYKYIGKTKTITTVNGEIPVPKQSLLRQPINVQKELIRQFAEINGDLSGATSTNTGLIINDENVWFKFLDDEIVKRADELAKNDNLILNFYITDSDGKQIINSNDEQIDEYMRLAREEWVLEVTDNVNESTLVNYIRNNILTDEKIDEIVEVLNSDLDQFVIKQIKYNDDGTEVLDEDGNIVYEYKYTRTFMVETNDLGEFIERDIYGMESVITDKWEDITAPNVGYYRFGKTFTILDTKIRDQIVVRLLDTGAEEFTSKRITATGGEITFAIDFNIEEDDGVEIPFEVIYEELSWLEGTDYIQEGQDLTLTMVEEAGKEIIIRRNDEFELSDIVVLERKDLVFIEVWHEAVDETDFIFPFGNVQYQGDLADNIATMEFDHVFYSTIDGEESEIPDGHIQYCQAYQKSNIIYNYYDGTEFETITDDERKIIDDSFVEDQTVGKGWKLSLLTDEEKTKIFKNSDHNLYFDGDKLVQIRYRTRIVALNLFNNYFKGTSEYMSDGLRFQGKSPITSRIVTKEVGEDTTGEPITETVQIFAGGTLVQASNPKSLLYKEGKLFDDALFTVEEETDLSQNGYVYAVPVAIINRRNQGVYHPEFNDNGTSFFINGIYVSEDEEDFADDITGFTLVDENDATLETSSVGRDRKAKFKVMLKWLFDNDYKAGGSMVSKTTYRPDGLLFDEINISDVIDLRIDANDQRKRIEDLEANVEKGFKDLDIFRDETSLKFQQTTDYINTTANLLYQHISETEEAIRKDMIAKDDELTAGLEMTNTNLADLSANVFTKDITKSLLIDAILGLTDYNTTDAFLTGQRPTRDEIEGMINAFAENMEGPYTKAEFMKFLVTVLKLVVNKSMLTDEELDRWIRRLSIKDLSLDPETEIYSRAETLELIYEGMVLASSARVLPPVGSDNVKNWTFSGKRFAGWLGTRHLDLKKDFIENGRTPVAEKEVNVSQMTKNYTDRYGKVWNKGYIAGPTIWGNVHNYHAIYTTWIFVETPFKLDYVKMNGDDPHAIFINEEVVATNKYCCRDTAYSYNFAVRGWYRIDMVYSERGGGHAVQLGWNPKDYTDKIKYMTTMDMDEAVRITKLRLENWASKMKELVSTIKGDATGYFTKLETKLILIEGLQRITNDILSEGPTVSESHLIQFHTGDATKPGLESWIDNLNNDGKFSALGYEVQEGTNLDGTKYPRPDEFRPIVDTTGFYNKDEVVEIIRKGLQLANGIDSLNSDDIQKWVDRLDIKLDMSEIRYYTKTQVTQLLKDGSNYLAGLDTVTSYEISDWLNNHISNYDLSNGGTDVNRIFNDANGNDLSVTTTTDVYSKSEFKDTIATEVKKILGAQAAKTQ